MDITMNTARLIDIIVMIIWIIIIIGIIIYLYKKKHKGSENMTEMTKK